MALLLCADGPIFVVEPRDQSADVGNQSATLSCLVDSRPQASMAWTLANAPAMQVLSKAETLVVRPVTERDFTSYRCTATVSGFTTVSRVVRLRRNGPSCNILLLLLLLLGRLRRVDLIKWVSNVRTSVRPQNVSSISTKFGM